MELEAVLFDFDGTLANTEHVHYLSWKIVFSELGLKVGDYEQYAGKSAYNIAKKILEENNVSYDEVAIEDILSARSRVIRQIFSKQGITLMPYAKEIFDFAKEHFKVAIVSNSKRENLLFNLSLTPFKPDVVVSVDDVKRVKPFPDMYLKALELLGIKAKNAIAIEDTQAGVESAKQAGVFVIAVPSKEAIEQDFSKADVILNDLFEAEQYIKKNFEI